MPEPHCNASGAVAQGFAEGGPVGAALAAAQLGVQALTAVIGDFASGAQMALNDVRDAFKDMSDDIFSGEMDITVAVNIATIRKSNWWGGYDREATKEAQEDAQEHYDYMRGLQANFLAAGYDAEHHMAWERRRLAATTNEELIALNEELHQAGLQAYANVELLGGPTGESIQDFHRLNEAWGQLDQTGQVTALATENYAQKMLEARDAGHELTAAQHAMADSAEQLNLLWDEAVPAAVNAFDKAKSAGTDAYDTVLAEAIESGLGQEEAIAKATAAQLAASEAVLAAEGEKFARIAAFEAALDAVRSGNAEGATAAALLAAQETRLAWDTAMDAVTLADDAATSAMSTDWSTTMADVVGDAGTAADGVIMALDTIPTEYDVTINYHGVQTGDHSTGGGGTQDIPGFASGSGGIRDFGTGTPATLHGREGVFTEAQIQRLIDAAIKRGGSGGGGGHVTATLRSEDGRYLAELVLENTPDAAERLGLT